MSMSLTQALRIRRNVRDAEVTLPVAPLTPATSWTPEAVSPIADLDQTRHALTGEYLWSEDVYAR